MNNFSSHVSCVDWFLDPQKNYEHTERGRIIQINPSRISYINLSFLIGISNPKPQDAVTLELERVLEYCWHPFMIVFFENFVFLLSAALEKYASIIYHDIQWKFIKQYWMLRQKSCKRLEELFVEAVQIITGIKLRRISWRKGGHQRTMPDMASNLDFCHHTWHQKTYVSKQ